MKIAVTVPRVFWVKNLSVLGDGNTMLPLQSHRELTW
jgi:hypothetical protein